MCIIREPEKWSYGKPISEPRSFVECVIAKNQMLDPELTLSDSMSVIHKDRTIDAVKVHGA